MATPRDILVMTSGAAPGLTIKKYLKPVSAHLVAGTGFFSDFMGGLSDVFGGRSQTYQNHLSALYADATERLKAAAYEIGANCIIGLNIDFDEISGKGKSMFMLTAIGTAVIIDKNLSEKIAPSVAEKFENVAQERVDSLRNRKKVISAAEAGNLSLNENVWVLITENQVSEVLPYLISRYDNELRTGTLESQESFHKNFMVYLQALPAEDAITRIYNSLETLPVGKLAGKILEFVKVLRLFDSVRCQTLLESEDFVVQKRGLIVAVGDKPSYNRDDLNELRKIVEIIISNFPERGRRTHKKALLSSKEKEVWTCECGKVNDIGENCGGCEKDIFGFTIQETKPKAVEVYLNEKIELIKEYLN